MTGVAVLSSRYGIEPKLSTYSFGISRSRKDAKGIVVSRVSLEETTREAARTDGDDASPARDAANSEWPSRDPSAASTIYEQANGSLVAVVSGDGVIRSVIDRPPADDNLYPEELAGRRVEDIWPDDIAPVILANCRRALRSRKVRSERARSEALSRNFEMIFIVQGRDSVMLVCRDVTETHTKISRLKQLAFEDRVTGLPNREWLEKEVASSLQHLNLQAGRAALIQLEIDELDVLRDLAPEPQREMLLAELAARMRGSLRGANQPDEQDDERYSAVARIDSERFAIFLPSIETGEDAEAVTSRIVELLETPVSIGDRSAHVKVAAGIALYPQDGRTGEELFASAATAMRDAKNSETLQQRFHSGTMRMRALERQDFEQALQSALANEEFALSYLPIVTAQGNETVAAEALLRWPQPLFGNKSIREVVAAAEYTGLILPIGEWVFENACARIAAWHGMGFEDLKVAVNVSAQEFSLGKLVARTKRLLEESEVEPQSVVIEITERLLFRDSLDSYLVCRGLKELGVDISVDDYGTGVCSFDHLSRSPVDSVKIHPGIVARSAGSGPSRAACAAVTAMAHALGIRVVAEGVETPEQAASLKDIGCDYLQGFLFSRPVSADEFTALLEGKAA